MVTAIASVPLFLLSVLSDVPSIEPAPAAVPAVPAPAPASPPPEATPERDYGFALEVGTSGLAGSLGGALGVGEGSRRFAAGVAFDLVHASLSENQSGSDNNDQLSTTALSVGPWLRWAMGHTLDGRVDVIGALDVQYRRQSATLRTDSSLRDVTGTASGVVLRIGPGVRFWATPWLALAYTAQISLTSLSGPLAAFSPASTLGPLDYTFDDTEVAMVGRFSALAIF
jgi:hypothetical protein